VQKGAGSMGTINLGVGIYESLARHVADGTEIKSKSEDAIERCKEECQEHPDQLRECGRLTRHVNEMSSQLASFHTDLDEAARSIRRDTAGAEPEQQEARAGDPLSNWDAIKPNLGTMQLPVARPNPLQNWDRIKPNLGTMRLPGN
jgi:hypothetical protein